MELIETNGLDIRDPEIRRRDEKSTRNRHTHHYLAMDEGMELGLVSADFESDWENDHFVIYELFVPVCLCRRGYANRMLQAAEAMAVERGYKSTLLVAKTMDKSRFTQEDLEAWYSRHGYTVCDDYANQPYVKLLVPGDGVIRQ